MSKTFTAWPSKFQRKENISTKSNKLKNLSYSQTILNNYIRNDSFERITNNKSDDNDLMNFKSNETYLTLNKPKVLNTSKAKNNVFRYTDENILSKLNSSLIKTFEKGSLSELKHRFRFNPQ